MLNQKISRALSKRFNEFRLSLAYIDALPQLAILGLFVGVFTGLIIVAFRILIDAPLTLILLNDADNFESLSVQYRILFIMGGAILLGTILHFLEKPKREMGIAHVLDRLHNFQGQLPATNWIWQFICGIICMLSGQSVGREGPAVHMGAGAGSQLGQWLRLPNNSMNTIVACGVAAGISASFDTPMAGVIFAMEVIVLEYTIVGFVPVILASVVGTAISQIVLGEPFHFDEVNNVELASLMELFYMIAVGIVIAVFSATYVKLHITSLKFNYIPVFFRLVIAGCIGVIAAIYVPQTMGLGYDTINQAVTGELVLASLLIIALAKLFVTPTIIGLGVPGGLIGPCLIIGACAGGALGVIFHMLFPELGISIEFYVMIGMAGMMAATLNAPLAALVAVLELSYNPNIIFPAMLVVVIACIFTRQIFRFNSIFIEQLNHTKRSLEFGRAEQVLKKVGVQSIMNKAFRNSSQICDYEEAKRLLEIKPDWIVIEVLNKKYALRAADLSNYLEDPPEEVLNNEQDIDLMEIPARRDMLVPVNERANLLEAMAILKSKETKILYVSRGYPSLLGDVTGILTLHDIENYYQPKEFSHVSVG